jgi:phage FluMu protein Com
MAVSNTEDGKKLARESRSGVKPEKCPKCGKVNIAACPGGSSVKAVQGIWWSCQDCHHEW